MKRAFTRTPGGRRAERAILPATAPAFDAVTFANGVKRAATGNDLCHRTSIRPAITTSISMTVHTSLLVLITVILLCGACGDWNQILAIDGGGQRLRFPGGF